MLQKKSLFGPSTIPQAPFPILAKPPVAPMVSHQLDSAIAVIAHHNNHPRSCAKLAEFCTLPMSDLARFAVDSASVFAENPLVYLVHRSYFRQWLGFTPSAYWAWRLPVLTFQIKLTMWPSRIALYNKYRLVTYTDAGAWFPVKARFPRSMKRNSVSSRLLRPVYPTFLDYDLGDLVLLRIKSGWCPTAKTALPVTRKGVWSAPGKVLRSPGSVFVGTRPLRPVNTTQSWGRYHRRTFSTRPATAAPSQKVFQALVAGRKLQAAIGSQGATVLPAVGSFLRVVSEDTYLNTLIPLDETLSPLVALKSALLRLEYFAAFHPPRRARSVSSGWVDRNQHVWDLETDRKLGAPWLGFPRQEQGALSTLWKFLIQGSMYATYLSTAHSQAKEYNLRQHGPQARLSYLTFKSHPIDVRRFNAIYFDSVALLFSSAPADSTFVDVPLFFDKLVQNNHFYKPWLSRLRSKKDIIMFVDPYSNMVYYLNMRKVSSVHFKIYNLSGPVLSPRVSRPYILKRNLNFTNIHFLWLRDGDRPVTASEYHFSSWQLPIPVATPSVQFSPPKRVLRKDLGSCAALLLALQGQRQRVLLPVKLKFSLLLLYGIHSQRVSQFLSYEYRAFKWKFFNRRWYYSYSRWKRATAFRMLLTKSQSNYSKLRKAPIFTKLFRAHVSYVLGISEHEMWHLWGRVRHGQNTHHLPLLARFSQSLQLKLDSLSMLLGLAPNRPTAQELVRCGSFRINGFVTTDSNFVMSVNDLLQLELNLCSSIRSLYPEGHWATARTQVQCAGFVQPVWSLMMFTLVRWPYRYELVEESILTERWVRYYVRHFPVKVGMYRSPQTRWLKY